MHQYYTLKISVVKILLNLFSSFYLEGFCSPIRLVIYRSHRHSCLVTYEKKLLAEILVRDETTTEYNN
jgi:hypothetical protein